MDNDENEVSYAISVGEGTLLTYGTGDITKAEMPGLEEYEDVYTIIIGPADGTGE